ncbi:Alpha-muurolene synthase {ECO:0000269/PubMed:19400802, ECO:0000269/PubMed:20889795}; AltName: Full=Gamma-muurolene synthase; {ECO:0000269/PubMed:19400802, ECO:0000269/PubMed:20889795}; AltName: Full=Germacrene-A synthase; {ECO:0000269/PubMed:19400802, ECO:0000269/PubMed:20889795} [Serendipita indica DSM 11827]|uniref:Terpene synthase n=1 Tax=Serendipita indica (strain DSM 11827) TaxID=1109443 RepID=G4TNA6_SERID|nr:Alpha-muurolene synthase {ECO:0000269/PubMed:19400802, ECO:0000269/PubMed:20889795}; AltName: Full=Gamma-muurolene synthase; {ECO:0000269/PubMed:19400802, ECO:0000269/PubMed:20889795}; AltName: Full=Germacrene-A synthase; {ECO:0000269/PubMed:19400802, ECO:0000269/PubMed:20889795} [Serendipita indica DSM 11827]CCA72799.1 hypothetical protein PIIN_06735 [Serendipita indica DSM 11827]
MPSVSPATIRLPDILGAMDRFELRTHPDEREVTRASNEWFNSYNMMPPALFEKFVKCDFGLMTGMSYPDTDATRLRITCDYMSILFAYDDLMDLPSSDLMHDKIASDKAAKIMMGVLTHPHKFRPYAGLPVATAFHDFWTRFCATSTPKMQKRFTDTTYEYVMAVKNQCGNRQSSRCPTIEEYVALRRDTSAIKVTYACIEYCLNIDVPDEAFYHPSVAALQEAGNDILSWANDVYSFDNEQSSGDCHNLVAIVAINKNITVQAAMEYVMGMIDSAIERFFEECANVPSFGPEVDPLVQAYIKGVELYLSGSVFWHLESERYFGARVQHVKDTLMVELRPLDEGAKPAFDLMYKLPSNLTPEVLSAAAVSAAPAAPAPVASPAPQPEILSPTPISPINVNFPLGNVACPPPSYETQRVLAKMVAATVEEKQRLAYSQPAEQYYSPAPQYYPSQPVEKFQQTNVLETAFKGSNSELTNILVIASVLMAGSPMALVPFVPLLALLLLPNETPVAPVA